MMLKGSAIRVYAEAMSYTLLFLHCGAMTDEFIQGDTVLCISKISPEGFLTRQCRTVTYLFGGDSCPLPAAVPG